ncbi:MAG: hypothetical protein ACKPKO_20065, partial [Candidatus Fonsibacter sp.]
NNEHHMGATNTTFLRLHAAVRMQPQLRPDNAIPPKIYLRHGDGIEPFEGVFLIFVDVAYGFVRSALDTLNKVVPTLGIEGARVNTTPIRSFATNPMEKRVTLIIDLPKEPTDVWEFCENLWVQLYRSA